MNNQEYRIENVRLQPINGRMAKTFRAYKRDGDKFVFCGQFSAPPRTPIADLWKYTDPCTYGVQP